MKILTKKVLNELHNFFVMSEQDYATSELQVMAETKAEKPTKQTENDFLYSRACYDTCKNVSRILGIKYSFLFE